MYNLRVPDDIVCLKTYVTNFSWVFPTPN